MATKDDQILGCQRLELERDWDYDSKTRGIGRSMAYGEVLGLTPDTKTKE